MKNAPQNPQSISAMILMNSIILHTSSQSFYIMKIDASFKWTGNTLCLSLNVFQYESVEIISIHGWISLQ